jgi:hypothetical protein
MDRLKAVARSPRINHMDNPLFGKPNELLDETIKFIKEQNPSAFLTESELPYRVFMHKPRDNSEVPYAAYYHQ